MLIFATLIREETLTIRFIQACNRVLNQKEFKLHTGLIIFNL